MFGEEIIRLPATRWPSQCGSGRTRASYGHEIATNVLLAAILRTPRRIHIEVFCGCFTAVSASIKDPEHECVVDTQQWLLDVHHSAIENMRVVVVQSDYNAMDNSSLESMNCAFHPWNRNECITLCLWCSLT